MWDVVHCAQRCCSDWFNEELRGQSRLERLGRTSGDSEEKEVESRRQNVPARGRESRMCSREMR